MSTALGILAWLGWLAWDWLDTHMEGLRRARRCAW